MAIPYAGGTRVNYTFTDNGTRADIVSKLETQLTTAGWTVISGSGTGDVLIETAAGNNGQKIRMRLYDPGSGNCAQITMKNTGGTASQIYYLLPGSTTWRIVANKYQFFMFRTGAANRQIARGIVMGGTIWMPDWVAALCIGTGLECGWIIGNGLSDTFTDNTYATFRNVFYGIGSRYASSLFNNWFINYNSDQQAFPTLASLIAFNNADDTRKAAYWQDGSAPTYEAYISWSQRSGVSDSSKFKGLLYDAIIVNVPLDGEITLAFDTHDFITITDQNTTPTNQATLCIAID